MLGRFDDFGVRFCHPIDWSVEVEPDDDLTNITLGAPDGLAFAIIRLDSSRPDPAEVLAEAAEILRADYPTLHLRRVDETIGGQPATGFDADFFQFDVANCSVLRCFRTDRRTVFFLGQWSELEDEDPGEVLLAIRRSIEEIDPADD